ncbi:hypothetical protein ACVW0Y_001489, partial [Pseudomonas sp. TE3786]
SFQRRLESRIFQECTVRSAILDSCLRRNDGVSRAKEVLPGICAFQLTPKNNPAPEPKPPSFQRRLESRIFQECTVRSAILDSCLRRNDGVLRAKDVYAASVRFSNPLKADVLLCQNHRHSSEGWNPESFRSAPFVPQFWIPAYAGMTGGLRAKEVLPGICAFQLTPKNIPAPVPEPPSFQRRLE